MFIQQRLTNYAEHYNTGGDRQTDRYIDKDKEIKTDRERHRNIEIT